MFEQFRFRAEGVNAEVHRVRTVKETLGFILGFLQKEGVADLPGSYAVWADCGLFRGIDLRPLREIDGLKFEFDRETAAGAKIGISQADWCLADTGTVVQDSTAIGQRLVSSLTAIHIAIAATSSILPDLPTLLEKIDPEKSGYIAMITGPSRTADIERVLTIGVHGPERLLIVFCDELGGEAA